MRSILSNKKNIHFVGIGGIGMSAIAHVLSEMGYKVSGSDVQMSDITRKIEARGGRVFEGHKSSNISRDVDVLVYSSSIHKDNPELKEAARRKVKVVHRAEMLAELFNRRRGIAVTGTHGKTTTTSLVSVMLKNAGLDPTVLIGGEVDQFKGNASLGQGLYIVAEADESDSSFLHLKPFYAVITNIEMEHIDHYRTLDDAKESYRRFIDNSRRGGIVFYNYGDRNIKDVLEGFKGKTQSFGFCEGADIYAVDVKMDGFSTSFKCVYKKKALGTVRLNIPGRHNVLNALAAILVGFNLGLDFKSIKKGIKDFRGAKRRFQLRSQTGRVILIDDYAHHPTEIRAVLDACANWGGKRIIAIFQPHRYTRTLFLADDFGRCFYGVDKLILTDIYAAGEKAIKGVSIKNIYDKVKSSGLDDVEIIKKEDIADFVMKLKKPGDMILVLGAGDIKEVADELCERLEAGALMDERAIGEFKSMIKGKVATREAIARHTSFRIGGPADIWVEPSDIEDLKVVLTFASSRKIPVFVIGNGTNLLASDSGFRGIIVHLGADYFKRIKIKGTTIRIGSGFSLPKLVRLACLRGLSGFESLVGIPGTVGGAVYMNAGGSTNPVYKNIGEMVTSLKVMDYKGRIKTLKAKDVEFGYRTSNLGPYIILEVLLKTEKGSRDIITSSCDAFLNLKKEKQVLDMPSAGCIFKNPSDFQFTCGQMIDMLGLKGKRIGGAEISAKHANFIVNRNEASCKDVMALAGLVKRKIKSNYDVDLELEVKVI